MRGKRVDRAEETNKRNKKRHKYRQSGKEGMEQRDERKQSQRIVKESHRFEDEKDDGEIKQEQRPKCLYFERNMFKKGILALT